jgi:hypothetical protein
LTPETGKMRRSSPLAAFVGCLCMAFAAAAQQAAPPPAATAAPPAESTAPAASGPEEIKPKIAPLLLLILSGMASEFGKQVGTGAGKEFVQDNPGLFTSLLKRLGLGGKKSETAAAGNPEVAPAIGYSVQKLDPRSFEVVGALEVGEAPTVLKTGDVFAIQYSTNLPGQIRLENIDPAGRVSNLGTYTVLVDQLNRLPRDKGIRLEGEPGIEILNIYFYPCLPPGAAGQPMGKRFESRLPNCGNAPNTLVAAASGTVQMRSLVNLSQPEATLAFAGLEDYRMNEVTLTKVQIKHERPGNGK